MRKRKLILGTLLLAAVVVSLFAYRNYQNRYAKVSQIRYEKTVAEMDLSGQPLNDLEELRAFPNLKKLDLRGTEITAAEFETVKAWLPEAEILWDIPFQGAFYPMDTEELTVEALTEADAAVLGYFVQLKRISAEACPDYRVLHKLRMERPNLYVSYTIPVGDEKYDYDVRELVLSGEDAKELLEVLPYFTELEQVELTVPLAPAEELMALTAAFPEVAFSWNLELAGLSVNEKTETLDLTGIPMTVEQMDAVLPYLLSLSYVDMTDCGISNEEMDDLNRRYENIKIVWTVDIGKYFRLRTDATAFMPWKEGIFVNDEIIYNLRYCTDMIAIDLGHKKITNIDFVAFMPHLKYLLLCETMITDLTPLTGLTELVYLELFMLPPQDLSPLLTLTGLEDLNLHYTQGDANIIAQMTWLKNLWWRQSSGTPQNLQQMLQEALPNCHINFTSISSTGEGWRKLPNYYAQREIFGMYFMD
ncbi:MAG: hypothetical protein E7465_00975 [Ruminococcaceae bacterium]|nr:hypothetical protein [Oscillospiraceae bacterium]